VYDGSGSTDDHNSFSCVVNSQVPADLAAYMQSAARFRQAGSAVPISTRIDWQLEVLAGVPYGGDYAEQLSGVRDKVLSGNTKAACGQLQGYLNHVSAEAGKEVETLLADSMLGVGRSIQDDLGCRQKPR
jgi:hypothetical protein